MARRNTFITVLINIGSGAGSSTYVCSAIIVIKTGRATAAIRYIEPERHASIDALICNINERQPREVRALCCTAGFS